MHFVHQDGFVRVENTARFGHPSVEHPWSVLKLMAHCGPLDSENERSRVLSVGRPSRQKASYQHHPAGGPCRRAIASGNRE